MEKRKYTITLDAEKYPDVVRVLDAAEPSLRKQIIVVAIRELVANQKEFFSKLLGGEVLMDRNASKSAETAEKRINTPPASTEKEDFSNGPKIDLSKIFST